jgi:hypothetical protein
MKKLLLTGLFFIFLPLVLMAVTSCPECGYKTQNSSAECPKCLRLIRWPYTPQRTLKAKVVVRTGKDAFIRHPNSQNRAFKANRNAGADLSGQIGSWGFLTGLRYLIRFDIPESFALAKIDMKTFRLKRAKLRLVIADEEIKQQIPIRVYPLTTPFEEGTGRFHIRSKIPDGCTWQLSARLMPWQIPGGDYNESISSFGILGKNGKHECVIDVTEVLQHRFDQFSQTGKWNDPGMIIMRDSHTACQCTFLNIFSFESRPKGIQVISPQLFIE